MRILTRIPTIQSLPSYFSPSSSCLSGIAIGSELKCRADATFATDLLAAITSRRPWARDTFAVSGTTVFTTAIRLHRQVSNAHGICSREMEKEKYPAGCGLRIRLGNAGAAEGRSFTSTCEEVLYDGSNLTNVVALRVPIKH